MIALRIHHKTTYRYRPPVSLGPHRLMLRPRESRDLRLISNDVTVTPEAAVTWAQDVFGNAVATATFQAMADSLVIDSLRRTRTRRAAPGRSSMSPPLPFPIRSNTPTTSGPISAR